MRRILEKGVPIELTFSPEGALQERYHQVLNSQQSPCDSSFPWTLRRALSVLDYSYLFTERRDGDLVKYSPKSH